MVKNGANTIPGKDITVERSGKIVVQASNDMVLKAKKFLKDQAVRLKLIPRIPEMSDVG